MALLPATAAVYSMCEWVFIFMSVKIIVCLHVCLHEILRPLTTSVHFMHVPCAQFQIQNSACTLYSTILDLVP